MLKNYLKIAYRNFIRHLSYSLINISGLSIGIACCLLILIFINEELTYDSFHKDADRIYRVIGEVKFEGVGEESASMPFPTGPALLQDYPDLIEESVRFFNFQSPTLSMEFGTDGSKRFNEPKVFLVDSTLFSLFSFKLISGNPKTVLNEPNSVVITESMKQKYFGPEEALGKTLRFENRFDLKVTGIMKDVPQNSHLQFDFLLSFSTVRNFFGGRIPGSWYWNPCWTYIKLREGVDPQQLKTQFPEVVKKYYPDIIKENGIIDLQPLSEIHLYSNRDFEMAPNGDIAYVYIFSAVALFVLLVACTNYLNLSTARSANRAKEVGLRKVLGAFRKELVKQFISESIIFCILSTLLAVGLLYIIVPWFNGFTNKNLNINILFFSNMIYILICIPILVGLLAGLYPAFFLSAFRPVSVLKGTLNRGAKSGVFRKVLVIFQFSLSIILMIGTFMAFSQLEFMQSKKLGFEKDQIVMMQVHRTNFSSWYNTFRDRVLQNEQITNVTSIEDILGAKYQTGNYIAEGSADEKGKQIPRIVVNFDFIETFGLEMLSGRSFSRNFPADSAEGTILNESAVKLFGWTNEEAIGKFLRYEQFRVKVTGVVKDFNYASLHNGITPFIVELPHRLVDYNFFMRYVAVKIKGDNISQTLNYLKNTWQQIVPNRTFEFTFLDEDLNKLYKSEEIMGRVLGVFSFLAIFIACLGLFALASFTAEQRTKEIGIRKTLGATTRSTVQLLSMEFIKLVLLANVIAYPAAYFSVKFWLYSFAYRTELVFSVFFYSSVLTALIALLTVSYQAYKAAVQNPAKSLRSE